MLVVPWVAGNGARRVGRAVLSFSCKTGYRGVHLRDSAEERGGMVGAVGNGAGKGGSLWQCREAD